MSREVKFCIYPYARPECTKEHLVLYNHVNKIWESLLIFCYIYQYWSFIGIVKFHFHMVYEPCVCIRVCNDGTYNSVTMYQSILANLHQSGSLLTGILWLPLLWVGYIWSTHLLCVSNLNRPSYCVTNTAMIYSEAAESWKLEVCTAFSFLALLANQGAKYLACAF